MIISVCIPCYRSAKTLKTVVEGVKKEFQKRPEFDYQFVLVNDGSPDNTFDVIQELCKNDKKIIGVDHSRNYGQSTAKMTALKYAKGDIIVFMDDDGQHEAGGVFKLADKLIEGNYDVVYAYFPNKKHSLFKKITSNMHNSIAEKMGNKPKGIHRSSFSAWSRTVADAAVKYKSPFVSIGSYLMCITTKYGEVEMEHRERLEGKSGYTLKKLFKMWFNIFFSFSMIPLRITTYLGAGCSLGSFIWGIILIIRKLVNPYISAGYTSTVVLILFIGGILMLFLGILGEFVGRTYMTVSGMPQYNVRRTVNVDE